MNQKGLGRFGVTASTVLREKTTDSDDFLICPECGHPVGSTLQGHEVAHPDVVDKDVLEIVGDSLVIHGWKCDRHPGYEVVMPTPVGSQDVAEVVHPGWTGVRVAMADEFVRTVAVPERELRETPDELASDAEERGSA